MKFLRKAHWWLAFCRDAGQLAVFPLALPKISHKRPGSNKITFRDGKCGDAIIVRRWIFSANCSPMIAGRAR